MTRAKTIVVVVTSGRLGTGADSPAANGFPIDQG
jgi:hypothetical protein